MMAILLQTVDVAADEGLTPGGWAGMLISVAFVTLLLAWCVVKVVRTPGGSKHVHSPSDPTPDA